MDERLKKNELERGRDSSVSTRHYVAAGTNLYKGKTKTPRKVSRAVERGRHLDDIIQGEKPHPNWKPATVSTGCTGARIRVSRRGLRRIRNGNYSEE